MKSLPVYQNLNTSFVNLSALIRFLRDRNFAGRMQIRLGGYEAEITFGAENQMSVLEHDRVAGRIAEGDEALQRILIRARSPDGTINVFEFVENPEVVAPEIKAPEIKIPLETPISKPIAKPFSEKDLTALIGAQNGSGKLPLPSKEMSVSGKPNNFLNLVPENHSPQPLEFTNRVENRARQMQLSADEWETLLQIVGELFGAVENVLEGANLNFPAMLISAQAEVADDYPFLNPASGAFHYAAGKAEMSGQVSAKLFAASINEVLRQLLKMLDADPNLSEHYRNAVQRILALVYQRESLYDKFFITPQLSRILGV